MRLTAFVLILSCAACSAKPFGVRPTDDATWFQRENRSALDTDELSDRTYQFLRRENLADRHKEEPRTLIRDLDERLVERRDRSLAYYLAELAFLEGKHAGDPAEAARLFLSSSYYAYAFLFDASLGDPASEYVKTFRWAGDFYNRSLGRVVTHIAQTRPLRDGKGHLPMFIGDLELVRGKSELAWDPAEFSEIHVAYNFEVRGLPGSARSYGLGVPMIAVKDPDVGQDPYLPRVRQSYAATVFVRFEGSVGDEVHRATTEIYNPMRTDTIEVAGRSVPLEADLTIPLAHTLENAPSYSGFRAMRDVEEAAKQSGLFMLEPYQPDKIPVLFVHGLMSSPLTWVPMFNDLLADPVLRKRYQFWFFRYPTGFPVLYSASLLRQALRSVRQTYDPQGTSPTFNDMVLCGHSMGGLLSRTMVHTSGDRLWSMFADAPIDEFDFTEEQKGLLKRSFFFERQPYIQRVVFMAVPHRGSELATGFIGNLGASMVKLPGRFLALGDAIEQSEHTRNLPKDLKRAMTGVGNLSPKNQVLTEIAKWEYPADLPVHCIMGNEKEAGQPDGTDGLVPYWSSHIDGVESELIVKSGHSVHWKAPAILEVRRVLHLHLEE